MQKKGVSPVIATVMLILLTIAAVGIIAGFLIPFVKNSLTDSTTCFSYRDYFKFEQEFGYNCYAPGSNGTNYLHAVSVRAGSDSSKGEDIKGFELVFMKAGSSTKKSIVKEQLVNLESGGIRMLDKTKTTLATPQSGEMRTYVLNAGEDIYKGVEVYPVLQTGKVCDMSDKIELTACRIDMPIG
jgi:flagellin-like protein